MEWVIAGEPLVPGRGEGVALVAAEPLSFWGGYDSQTGEIIDRRHPLSGQIAAGRVLALPFSRGSSTTTAVLLEAVRRGTAPAVILTTGHDTFFALAAVVAQEMYGQSPPVVRIGQEVLAALATGDYVKVDATGGIRVRRVTSA